MIRCWYTLRLVVKGNTEFKSNLGQVMMLFIKVGGSHRSGSWLWWSGGKPFPYLLIPNQKKNGTNFLKDHFPHVCMWVHFGRIHGTAKEGPCQWTVLTQCKTSRILMNSDEFWWIPLCWSQLMGCLVKLCGPLQALLVRAKLSTEGCD